MRIFLSWSGQVSRQVALVFREWLPKVIQAIDPWMSAEDIGKGSRWPIEIVKELEVAKAGIICVTQENQNAPWLNFEAGALSRTVGKDMVCPFVFQMKVGDLTGPLVQFQVTEGTKDDLWRLVSTLNKGVGPRPLSEAQLSDAFQIRWTQFESMLAKITSPTPAAIIRRSNEDKIDEVLALSRTQANVVQRMEALIQQINMGRFDNSIASFYPGDGSLNPPSSGLIDPATYLVNYSRPLPVYNYIGGGPIQITGAAETSFQTGVAEHFDPEGELPIKTE